MKQRTFLFTLATVFVLFGLLGCILLSVALWLLAVGKTTATTAPHSTPMQPTQQPDPGEAAVGEIATSTI